MANRPGSRATQRLLTIPSHSRQETVNYSTFRLFDVLIRQWLFNN